VKIEFDPKKSERNAATRELPFELVAEAIDWAAAHIIADERRDYGEERFLAFAPMRKRLHVVCYCLRGGNRRIISFRRANKREERFYAEEKAALDR
jgi:uncharacterized DUF497 family protein